MTVVENVDVGVCDKSNDEERRSEAEDLEDKQKDDDLHHGQEDARHGGIQGAGHQHRDGGGSRPRDAWESNRGWKDGLLAS